MNSIDARELMELCHEGKLESGTSAGADDALLVSIAISLKRIADAIDGKPETTGIHELINAIEWNTREAA
jgi:hypothetical protein